ncbi:TonB-dependent receptor plug domain-containing protein [Altericroceibacterium endophyticum]|uniref:TonB-dependent receptor n=1 Tax=Altericroceibacterium endophyticum TaxID=1808508 RepID=A0A6I4T8T0_9SPHN|nr:TonB-dependent receptor [Altericroceibacterium endophyticum]MXO66165.1 TonB-dependent receptor [Altericroceibacterium endophyticum]
MTKQSMIAHGRRVNAGVSLLALTLAAGLASPAMAQSADGQELQEPPVSTQEGPATFEPTTSDQTIVVTGSRLSRTGFDAPSPVSIVGADQIGAQGASNVAQVLNDIPAFRPQATPATTAIFANNIGASTADLRGLGANRTLVLIDGRRVVPSTVSGSSFAAAGAVDLNMIPASLIKRAEVVTGGASAAYGSDAVAGVVNVILDTDLDGIKGSVQYSEADVGDNEEWFLSLAGGTSFAEGRGRFVAGVDYVDNKGTGDCYSRDWCALSYNTISNPGGVDGLPPTIIAPNTRVALGTKNGLIIGGPLRGTEFNADGTTFQHDYGTYYGAGLFQSGGSGTKNAFYENFAVSSPSERINTFAHAEYDLSPGTKIFAEGAYSRVTATTLGAQRRDIANITITRDNAFLPDSVAAQMDALELPSFRMGRMWNDIGPTINDVKRETYRGVVGIEAELSADWSLDAYYQYGQTDYAQSVANNTINSRRALALDAVIDPDSGEAVCRATLAGDPAAAGCAPLNPFGDGAPTAAAVDYVTGTALQTTKMTQHVASLAVQGSLFQLPAGALAVATGVEFRKDKATGTADEISRALDFYTSPGSPIDGSVDVWEGFVELGAPITDTINLNGAVRLTDYSTSGSVTTWKVGADWEPFDWVRLRATRSRDIRAPNIFELFGPPQSSFQSINDPANGGAQVLSSVLLGGNVNLQPEKADTWTAGIVLQPDVGAGRLRLSVDYYDIQLDGAISTLGAQVILNRCDEGVTELCDLVTRDGDGLISQVRNYNLNLNTLITRGWDVEAYYGLPMSTFSDGMPGELSLRAMATIVNDLITEDPSGDKVDRAGMNGSPVSQPSGVPTYIINAYLGYKDDAFSGQVQLRHISDGKYNNDLVEGVDINDNHVGAWTYVNLNLGYKLWRDGDRNVELYGVVHNLFDKDPPVDIPSSFGPTNNVLYDVVGRTYRVGVRFKY